ncbi:MAG: hypothetical protein NTY39_01250 [Campylobacterales bacterium]|nr:hypothetical protein [Campylobacterales bacterium]
MTKLTKSQRKAINQKASELHLTEKNSLTLQQNNYHLGASEIDALHSMQNHYPALVDKIIGLRQQELDLQHEIISIEKNEQNMREKEAPYIRIYAFLGQFMAYSIGVFTLVGGAYFAREGNTTVAALFLTSTVGIAFAQFFKFKNKNEVSE